MRKFSGIILLIVFLGFIFSLSVNYSGYLSLINGGDPESNITWIPEENEESSEEEIGADKHFFLLDDSEIQPISTKLESPAAQLFMSSAYYPIPLELPPWMQTA